MKTLDPWEIQAILELVYAESELGMRSLDES